MKSTLLVAAVLAATFAVTSATPTFATKNTGAFNQSAEANTFHNKYCATAKSWFAQYNKAMNDAPKGSTEHTEARHNANEVLGNAWSEGCGWAA